MLGKARMSKSQVRLWMLLRLYTLHRVQSDAAMAYLQGPLASYREHVNTELQTPAANCLPDMEEVWQDQLDGQQFDLGAQEGLQAPSQLTTMTIPPRPPDPLELQPQAGLDLMHQAIAMLLGTLPDLPEMSDEAWVAHVKSMLLPLEHFRAGFISTRIDSWQLYFQQFGMTAKARQILQWLEHGLDISWVPVDSLSQQKHPRYAKKVELVRALLTKTVGAEQVASKLQGSEPQHVHFQNRASVSIHAEFVDDNIKELLRTGAIRPWLREEPITVSSGLGVALDRIGKKRLILDARYINLFDEYHSFSYESLADVPNYLKPDDFVMLTDLKAGYHQVRMHPGTHRFLGIQYGGQVYYFEHLPFGLSSACRAYTILMGEVYRPLRQRGQRMSYLIDDAFFVWKGRHLAKKEALVVLMIFTALGLFLSIPKCQLLAQPTGKFLGLLVNAADSKFEIPEEKRAYILQLLQDALQRESISARQMAKIAGVLLSVKEAVHMAPLYTRLLFRALSATYDWDSPVPELERQFAQDDLHHWKDYLIKQNGKSWLRRSQIYHAAGDVSGTGYAGYSSLLPAPMVMSYSTEDWEAMQADPYSLSSVLRETKNAQLVLETVIKHRSTTLQGALLVYTGDNQGSIACLAKMMGKGDILDAVRQVYEVAAAHDVALEFIWKPRESPEIQLADSLSRYVDTADFALNQATFQRLGKRWGFPTADVFAGGAHKFHKHNRYYTLHYTPKTAGVNAMLQDWNKLSNSVGRLLLWVFPAFQLVGAVIRKLLLHKTAAVLLLPAWTCYWTAMLESLPIVDSCKLPFHRGMYVMGSRLPLSMQQAGCPYALMAYKVQFTL